MKITSYIALLGIALISGTCSGDADSNVNPGAGRGGSMAQFTVYDGNLYLLQADKLETYSLENPVVPQQTSSISVGFDAETLFPSGGNMFIGSQNGMHIYSLENPQLPEYVSSYQHITSCDPVVVEGDYAYVTLRTGSPCRFGTNELQVINISQPAQPYMVNAQQLKNPQGLAVNEGTLYVCNGDQGLVVLDVTDPLKLAVLKEYSGFHGYDVIFTSRSLIMIGKTGLVQYDPRDPKDLKLLSVIPVEPVIQ